MDSCYRNMSSANNCMSTVTGCGCMTGKWNKYMAIINIAIYKCNCRYMKTDIKHVLVGIESNIQFMGWRKVMLDGVKPMQY